MKLKLLTLAVAALALTGCATSDYKGYSDIHVERAKTEATRYKALASVARNSDDPTTRALAAMALGIGGSGGSGSNAPVAAPQNESLEWGKLLVNGATGLYGLRVGAAIKLGDMSRGAADKDVLREGMSTLDIIRDTTPAQ